MTFRLFLFALVTLPGVLVAQNATITGRVVDGESGSPLRSAVVKLSNVADTSKGMTALTSQDGTFKFISVEMKIWRFDVSHLGFERYTRVIRIDKPAVSLGDVMLKESVIALGEVEVKGKAAPAVQKGDTTEFNATAFQTNRDASAEDLVAKMPGVTVEGGTVKAQGEDVQRVLVDGRAFFGTDPTLALRNLPADAIDKIQIFDRLSDQAEFTGFDDGQRVRTMNIVTRPERRNGTFGRTYAGYGNDTRYQTGGNVNIFSGDTRFSIIGLSNNVNQQNFSIQDLLGAVGGSGGGGGRRMFMMGGRSGGGGGGWGGGRGGFGGGSIGNFLVGQQNGIAKTHSIGTNYSDKFGNALSISGSYFFNFTNPRNDQRINRQYLASGDSSTLYNEVGTSNTKNYNHRFDSRIEYTIDSSHSLIVQPQLYFQSNDAANAQAGLTTLAGTSQWLNRALFDNSSSTSGNNISTRLTYRYRFDTPGRTLSLEVRGELNDKDGSGRQQSLVEYAGNTAMNDTLDQRSSLATDGASLSTRLVYTEPFTERGMLQFTYNPSFSRSSSDNRRFDFDPGNGTYSVPVPSLSNKFDNTYNTQNAGVGFRKQIDGSNLMIDLALQRASLGGEQEYPAVSRVAKTFYNVLPSATLDTKLDEGKSLRIFYRTSTRAPSISQLQNVVDNTNPLQLSTGNPDLKQSFTHTVFSRYSSTNPSEGESLFLLLSVQYATDQITNYTFTALRDTTVAGIRLSRGTQLTYPVNLDGYWSARSFGTFGFPVGLLSSNLNLNGGVNFSRTPGLVNGVTSFANSYALSAGSVLSSNISQDIDFTLSYSGSYTISRYSLQPELNNNYYNHNATVRMNLGFLDGFVFRGDVTHTRYTGLGGGYDISTVLLNGSLARKFFENERGELRFSISDILNQNKSVGRNVTESYIEDSENRVLGRYFMVTFTYTLR